MKHFHWKRLSYLFFLYSHGKRQVRGGCFAICSREMTEFLDILLSVYTFFHFRTMIFNSPFFCTFILLLLRVCHGGSRYVYAACDAEASPRAVVSSGLHLLRVWFVLRSPSLSLLFTACARWTSYITLLLHIHLERIIAN